MVPQTILRFTLQRHVMAGVTGDFAICKGKLRWNCSHFLGREFYFNRVGIRIRGISVTSTGLGIVVKSQLDFFTLLRFVQMTLSTVVFVEMDIGLNGHIRIYETHIILVAIVCQRNVGAGEKQEDGKNYFFHCPSCDDYL